MPPSLLPQLSLLLRISSLWGSNSFLLPPGAAAWAGAGWMGRIYLTASLGFLHPFCACTTLLMLTAALRWALAAGAASGLGLPRQAVAALVAGCWQAGGEQRCIQRPAVWQAWLCGAGVARDPSVHRLLMQAALTVFTAAAGGTAPRRCATQTHGCWAGRCCARCPWRLRRR